MRQTAAFNRIRSRDLINDYYREKCSHPYRKIQRPFEVITNLYFFKLADKLFGAETAIHLREMEFNFLSYYWDILKEDVYYLYRSDAHRFNLFVAYAFSRNEDIRNLAFHEPEFEPLGDEFSIMLLEKNKFGKNLFDYFYYLDKNVFNYKLPYWALHRENYNFTFSAASSTSAKNFESMEIAKAKQKLLEKGIRGLSHNKIDN